MDKQLSDQGQLTIPRPYIIAESEEEWLWLEQQKGRNKGEKSIVNKVLRQFGSAIILKIALKNKTCDCLLIITVVVIVL